MTLNSKQIKIVIISTALFIGMGLYPPWVNTFDAKTTHSEKPAGYALIVQPPKPEKDSYPYGVRLDAARFLVQWLTLLIATAGMLLLTNKSTNNKSTNHTFSKKEPNSFNHTADKGNHTESSSDTAQYPFSSNMPDVTKCTSELTFKADNYMLLFVKNPPTISDGINGQSSPISYRYAVVVVNSNNGIPQYFVTLESGFAGEGFLSAFDRNGKHRNLGKHPELLDESRFIVKALEIIKDELHFKHIEEVPLSDV